MLATATYFIKKRPYSYKTVCMFQWIPSTFDWLREQPINIHSLIKQLNGLRCVHYFSLLSRVHYNSISVAPISYAFFLYLPIPFFLLIKVTDVPIYN